MPMTVMRFRHKETGKVWEAPIGRYSNFLNSVKKIVNYVRYNYPKYYVLHLTLTVAGNVPDITCDHLHRVDTFIQQRLKRAGAEGKRIAVKENQERGAIHFQILYIYNKPYVFPDSKDIAKSWKLGFIKITAPKIRMRFWKIVNYIGKYIGKGYEYESLNVKKSFTASQIKQIYKLRSDRLDTVVQKFGLKIAETLKCTFRKVYDAVPNYCREDHKACKEFNCNSLFRDCMKKKCFTLSHKLIMEFPSEWTFEGMIKPCMSAFKRKRFELTCRGAHNTYNAANLAKVEK